MNLAAAMAPEAKTSRLRAACLSVKTSSGAREHDLVLADNRAAAHGGDAYLRLIALPADAVALVDILALVREARRDGVGQHKRGAARGVELAVVVPLEDFRVEIVPPAPAAA